MPNHDSLTLTADEMRALGYQVIDMLVQHFETLPEKPVTRKADRATMEARLREELPERGTDPLAVLDQVDRSVFGAFPGLLFNIR
jgi:hypothetical protein